MVKEFIYKEKINIYQYILGSIALILVVNFEQTVLFSLAISILAIVYAKKIKSESILGYVVFVISVLGLIFIFTCPGNFNRLFIEIGKWYPDYQMLSFLDKINMGLTATMYHFIKIPQAMLSYVLFIVGMAACILIKYRENHMYIFIMMINFLYMVIAFNIDNAAPYIAGMENFKAVSGETVLHLSAYLPTFISLLLFLWPTIGLYIIYQNELGKGLFLIGIYLLGFLIRFAMAFSPTIYVSGTRTYISAFFVLILINSIIYIKIFKSLRTIK